MAYFEQTRLTDSDGIVINPAEQQTLYTVDPPNNSAGPVVRTQAGSVDDQIILLRRIVKILETQAAADSAQRTRITLDAITAGLTLGTVGTVSTISGGTITTVSTVTNTAQLAGYDQRLYTDWARTAYNTGIRQRLTFT